MIQFLRERSSGCLAKGLLFLLAASFVLWGAEGLRMAQQGGKAAVAYVGDEKVTLEEVARDQMLLQRRISANYGALPQGMEGLLLQQAVQARVNALLYQQAANQWQLAVSPEAMKKEIADTPAFRDESGRFDRLAYRQVLADNGMSKAEFRDNVKVSLARGYLQDTVRRAAFVPPALAEAIHSYQQQQRQLSFLPVAMLPASETAASDKALRAYYDSNKQIYQSEELRTVGWLDWNIAEKTDAAAEAVPADEVEAFYKKNRSRYVTDEKRKLEQLVFDEENDARKAYDAARARDADTSLDSALAAMPEELQQSATHSVLGAVAADSLPAPLATAVFAEEAKTNDILEPVESSLGWHVVRITGITPGKVRSLEEASGAIRKELASQQVYDDIYTVISDLEDAVDGGASLQQAASERGLTLQTSQPLPLTTTADPDHPDQPYRRNEELLAALLGDAQVNVWQEPVEQDGLLVLAGLTTITAPKTMPFDAVKAQVTADYTRTQQEKRTRALLAKEARALQEGTVYLSALAERYDSEVRTGALASRQDTQSALTEAGLKAGSLKRLLEGEEGEAGYAVTADGGLLVQVTRVEEAAKADESQLSAVREAEAAVTAQVMLGEFEEGLRQAFPVTMRPEVLDSLRQQAAPAP